MLAKTRKTPEIKPSIGGDWYTPRLSAGGHSDLIPSSRDWYRRLFLHYATQVEPELLPSLRCVELADRSGLSSWAERWQLTGPWCQGFATELLTDNFTKILEGEVGIAWLHHPFAIPTLTLSFTWDPTFHRREDFKAHVQAQVAGKLEAYCDRIEDECPKHGLERAPRKRELRHFEWLARFQVKGESFESIATTDGVETTAVEVAARRTAKFIDLTLRSRPRKARGPRRVEILDRAPRRRK